MANRTKIITSAITPEEYKALREMAFRQEKTISTIIRNLLLSNSEFSQRVFLASSDETSSNMRAALSRPVV